MHRDLYNRLDQHGFELLPYAEAVRYADIGITGIMWCG